VVIVPEISSNSLIVSATPRYYDEIARLVEALDAQDPMVMIQVLIAEISLGDLDEFGVEFGLQDSLLFNRSLLGDILTTTTTVTTQDAGSVNTVTQDVIQSATLTPGFNFGDPSTGLGNAGSDTSLATAGNVAGQALSSFGVNRVSSEGGFGGLVLSASSNSISMLLRALQQSRRVEVLSRPQIMALDNQLGFAFVGQVVPFIVGSEISLVGTPQNTIERINVGLSLEVTPRISPDNLVVMTVYAANNRLQPISTGVPVAIAPNGDPILSPIVDSIEARTTVSAMSGQTVVLSGLLRKEDNALHRRVPILADIPLVGELFRYDSVSTTRNELLIILTPHVIRSRFEADMVKQIESARMSWCLNDVIDLHGPVGLRSRQDPAGAAEAETIYPEPVPAEQFAPTLNSPQLPYEP
jgi:type II secretory pathway component GspD/PulD (secretin)